jgi:tRNA (guanine26-N2/guanine27-N2)-dimethyltransferase
MTAGLRWTDAWARAAQTLNDESFPLRCIVLFQDGLTILEALSASGLRSIRYAKEVPGVREIIANDLSDVAVSSIRANVAHNGVEHLVTTSHDDAV